MATEWDVWLADLRAAGKGGQRFSQLAIDRGRPWSKELQFQADWSGDAFACALSLSPDGTTLVSPTVVVGAYSGGYTTVTLSLTSVQTANTSLIPADGDFDGVVDLAFELVRTPSGGSAAVLMGGLIPVIGKV